MKEPALRRSGARGGDPSLGLGFGSHPVTPSRSRFPAVFDYWAQGPIRVPSAIRRHTLKQRDGDS